MATVPHAGKKTRKEKTFNFNKVKLTEGQKSTLNDALALLEREYTNEAATLKESHKRIADELLHDVELAAKLRAALLRASYVSYADPIDQIVVAVGA